MFQNEIGCTHFFSWKIRHFDWRHFDLKAQHLALHVPLPPPFPGKIHFAELKGLRKMLYINLPSSVFLWSFNFKMIPTWSSSISPGFQKKSYFVTLSTLPENIWNTTTQAFISEELITLELLTLFEESCLLGALCVPVPVILMLAPCWDKSMRSKK